MITRLYHKTNKMVANQISTLVKQAITTFTCKNERFQQNLEQLRTVLDKTSSDDINLDPRFMSASLWIKQNKAPVTYIDIFENDIVSIGVFILKPGMKMPLHDHPQMYGLLKVVAGNIKIKSFSLSTNETKTEEKQPNESTYNYPITVTAKSNPDILIDSTCDACVLDPNNGNLHEIESIDGPAAFIDVLSPPYDSVIDDGPRKCTYFRIVKEINPLLYQLEEIKLPSWFWSDSYPYTGPKPFL